MLAENNASIGPELETPIRLVTEIIEEIKGVSRTTQIVLKVERSHSLMDPEQQCKSSPYYNNTRHFGSPCYYIEYITSQLNNVKREIKLEHGEMCNIKKEIKDEIGEIVKIKTNHRTGRPNDTPTIHLNHYPSNKHEVEEVTVKLRDRSPVSEKRTHNQDRETVIKELKTEIQNSDRLEKLNRRERSLNPERPWVYLDNKFRNTNESIASIAPVAPIVSITPAEITPAPNEANQPVDLITPSDLAINYYNQPSPVMDDSSNEGALLIATDHEDSEEEVQDNVKEQPEKNFRKANNPPDGKTLENNGINNWPFASQSATIYCQKLVLSDNNNTGNVQKHANVSTNTENTKTAEKSAKKRGKHSNNNGRTLDRVNSPSGQLVVVCDRKTSPAHIPVTVKPADIFVWNDSEGFYAVKSGETLNSRYSVYYTAGKGAFSNVVRARDNLLENTDVVIKIIRKHQAMIKMGLKELEVYKRLRVADRFDLFHCLRFKQFFLHRGHLCLVLEPMTMNMAQFIKFRRSYVGGLDLKIVEHLVPQIFLALKLLKRANIIHADIKPENILISHGTSSLNLKIGDFGSALTCGRRVQTPYLVSRYYRAPEIIVGSGYDHGIDIWATGCTLYEMATGRKMFRGESNNHMLKKIMEFGGRLPKKMIQNGEFGERHFTKNLHFKLLTGEDTLQETARVIPRIKRTRNLQAEITPPPPVLLNRDQGRKCRQLRDLLERMLCVNSEKRAPIEEIIGHRFIIN